MDMVVEMGKTRRQRESFSRSNNKRVSENSYFSRGKKILQTWQNKSEDIMKFQIYI